MIVIVVVTQNGRSSCVTQLTLFGQHEFWANILQIWSKYSKDWKLIFTMMDKEE